MYQYTYGLEILVRSYSLVEGAVFVAAHLECWQRSEDFGFIAERGARAIGTVWARQFSRDEQLAYYVDGRTPEVTIEVSEPSARAWEEGC